MGIEKDGQAHDLWQEKIAAWPFRQVYDTLCHFLRSDSQPVRRDEAFFRLIFANMFLELGWRAARVDRRNMDYPMGADSRRSASVNPRMPNFAAE